MEKSKEKQPISANSPLFLCFLCFVLSTIWIFLFPALSIVTGELKPRGIYVDESALLLHQASRSASKKSDLLSFDVAQSFSLNCPKYDDYSIVDWSMYEDICDVISTLKLNVHCHRIKILEKMDALIQISLDHTSKPISSEAVVVVLPLRLDTQCLILEFMVKLLLNLGNEPWLSKRIIFLLLPVEIHAIAQMREQQTSNLGNGILKSMHILEFVTQLSSLNEFSTKYMRGLVGGERIRFSWELEWWLRHYTSTPTSPTLSRQLNSNFDSGESLRFSKLADASSRTEPYFAGLIREAYVIDLSDVRERCDLVNNVTDKLEILIAGINGQLPNMDLVSTALTIIPHNSVLLDGKLRSASSIHSYSTRKNDVNDGNNMGILSLNFFLLQLLERIVNFLSKTCKISTTLGGNRVEAYYNRLVGLMEFSFELIRGPSGFHGQLLSHNIDAITLRPSCLGESFHTSDILSFTQELVRSSCNLHEELHHSHSTYLLMGPKHFAGLSEFAPSLLLLILPLILIVCCFWCTACNAPSPDCIKTSLCLALSDVAIVTFTTLVVVPVSSKLEMHIHLPSVFISSQTFCFHSATTNIFWSNNNNEQPWTCIQLPLSLGTFWFFSYLATIIKIVAFHRITSGVSLRRYLSVAMSLMCAILLYVGSFHYTLAASIAFLVVPISILLFHRSYSIVKSTRSKIFEISFLSFLMFLISPVGLSLILGDQFHSQALQDWILFGSVVAPVVQILSIITSSMILRYVYSL